MSGKEYNLRAVFSAVDKISGPMSKINKSIAGVRRAASNVGEAGANLGRAFAPVAAVGAAVGVFAGKAVNDFLNTSGALQDMSDRLGVSAEKLQEWQYVAEKGGVSSEDLQGSMEKLNKSLFAASSGKGDQAELFKKLGISVKDANGNLRNAADVMPELADAFKKNENATVRTAMAQTLMGKSGAGMIGTLSQGSEAIKKQQDEARKLGLILSDSSVAAGDAFSDETLGKFKSQLGGLVNMIGSKLVPVLTPLIEKMSAWLSDNQVTIAANISTAIDTMASAIQAINWDYVITGMKVVFGAIALGQVVSIASAVVGVGTSFAGLAVAMGPVGWAIAALVLAGALLYKNWDGVVGGLKIIWNDFMTWLAPKVDWVAEKIGKVGAIFSGIGNFASGAFGLGAADSASAPPQGRGAGSGLLAGANKQQLNGEMVVKFENAPQGMRVDQGKTNIPGMQMNPDVGYRSMAYRL